MRELSAQERAAVAVTVLCRAFRMVSELGWAPVPAHLFRPHNAAKLMELEVGTRISLLMAIRKSAGLVCQDRMEMLAQHDILFAMLRITGGLHVWQWEDLPMCSQENVLDLIGRTAVFLGGVRPQPLKRRGGWRVAS